MAKKLAVIAIVTLALGCKHPQPAQVQEPIIPVGTLKIDAVKADMDFSLVETFHMQLSQGRELIVEAKQTEYLSIYESTGGVEFSDKLKQPNGNWILFDCAAVADKVLDRDLVPEVEKDCAIVHAQALMFWKETPPNQFTDQRGVTWRKVNQ